MYKKSPYHFNLGGNSFGGVENGESGALSGGTIENRIRGASAGSISSEVGVREEVVNNEQDDNLNVIVGQKRKVESDENPSQAVQQVVEQNSILSPPKVVEANTDLVIEELSEIPVVPQVQIQVEEEQSAEDKQKGVYKNYKFKTLGIFKDKDEFMELLMGHSYSNKYSCFHNAVHQCMIHEEIDGTPCSHQFRICEKSDLNTTKTFELQERGEHSTSLKMDLLRGVHPLMVIDVDEWLMTGVTPSQIIKHLRLKYDGQSDMLQLIPKKTKIVSRKITARVKGPQRRSTFAYSPPVCSTPYVPPPKTQLEMQQQAHLEAAQQQHHLQQQHQAYQQQQQQHQLNMMRHSQSQQGHPTHQQLQHQHQLQQQHYNAQKAHSSSSSGGVNSHLLSAHHSVPDTNSFHDANKNYAVVANPALLQGHRGGGGGEDSSDSSDDEDDEALLRRQGLVTHHQLQQKTALPVYVTVNNASASLPVFVHDSEHFHPPLPQGIVATAIAAQEQANLQSSYEAASHFTSGVSVTPLLPTALESVITAAMRVAEEEGGGGSAFV